MTQLNPVVSEGAAPVYVPMPPTYNVVIAVKETTVFKQTVVGSVVDDS